MGLVIYNNDDKIYVLKNKNIENDKIELIKIPEVKNSIVDKVKKRTYKKKNKLSKENQKFLNSLIKSPSSVNQSRDQHYLH